MYKDFSYQQVLNTVESWLTRPDFVPCAGRHCDNSNLNQCKYRNGDNKCAVGVLIPDDLYQAKYEGKDVRGLIEDHPEVGEALHLSRDPYERHCQISFLKQLQRIHDEQLGKPNPQTIKDQIAAMRLIYSNRYYL